jgi:hypothetical protein
MSKKVIHFCYPRRWHGLCGIGFHIVKEVLCSNRWGRMGWRQTENWIEVTCKRWLAKRALFEKLPWGRTKRGNLYVDDGRLGR